MIRETYKQVPVQDPPVEANYLQAHDAFFDKPSLILNQVPRYDAFARTRLFVGYRRIQPLKGYEPMAGVDLGSIQPSGE